MSSLSRPLVRWVRDSAVPPMKCRRSPNRSLIAARRCEIRWSRSTCSGETPNRLATASCSSMSMPVFPPDFGAAERAHQALCCREFYESFVVAACVERRDSSRDVCLGIPEARSFREVQDGLFGSGYQCRTEGCLRSLGIQCVGVTPNEAHRRGPIRQCDRPVLVGYGDDRGCEGAGNGSPHSCGTDSHQYCVVRSVYRGGDARGYCFEIR